MNSQAHFRRRTCLGFALGLVTDLAIPHGLGELEAFEEETASGDAPGLRYRLVHQFTPEEGSRSSGGILVASDGKGYGTNSSTVYSINDAKQVKVLHVFMGSPRDGSDARSPPVEGDDGALYGVTLYGGSAERGLAYRLAHGGWTVLHHFGIAPEDGMYLWSGIIFASDGQFYGAAQRGGLHDDGVVYRMDKAGNVTPLWHFGDQPGDPMWPRAAPREGADGRLYGTSSWDTELHFGTIYSLSKDGSDRRVLHTFVGDEGGGAPVPVTFGSDGSIYGMNNGGVGGCGTVYRLDPDGALTVLHAFDGSDGRVPSGELLEYQPGVFIGTTLEGGSGPNPTLAGVVFMVRSDGGFQVLHNFGSRGIHGVEDLNRPAGALTLGPAGQVTGVCGAGGRHNCGGIWTMVPFA